MVFVVHVFNAMQQKAPQGKSHCICIGIIRTWFVNEFCNQLHNMSLWKSTKTHWIHFQESENHISWRTLLKFSMASLHIMHFQAHVLLDDNYNMLEFTMERYLVIQSQEMAYHTFGYTIYKRSTYQCFFRNFCF